MFPLVTDVVCWRNRFELWLSGLKDVVWWRESKVCSIHAVDFFFSVGAGMEGKLYIGSKHLHIEEGRGRNRGSVRMRRWVLSTSPHLALRGTSRPILTPDVVAFTTQGKQLWFHFPVPNVPSPTPSTPLMLSTHTHSPYSRAHRYSLDISQFMLTMILVVHTYTHDLYRLRRTHIHPSSHIYVWLPHALSVFCLLFCV